MRTPMRPWRFLALGGALIGALLSAAPVGAQTRIVATTPPVVVIIVAIIGYRRSLQSRERTEQDRRMNVQTQEQADLPGDRVSQREDRRLAGMTAEDREWEQASLERNRESQQ